MLSVWIFGLVLTLAILPVLISITRPYLRSEISKLTDVVFIFAHPDDETMFFLPVITLLQQLRVKFRFLCLSSGNYDGLGKVRIEELHSVARRLKAASCDVLENPKLRDGPHMWKALDVSEAVERYLSDRTKVDAIFTFDSHGISGHPNHISTFKGIVSMQSRPRVYSLKSEPIWRKYIPVLDFAITFVDPYARLVAVNLEDPFKSLSVMKLYGTQNVWFRKLFSVFSKYSYINEFVKL